METQRRRENKFLDFQCVWGSMRSSCGPRNSCRPCGTRFEIATSPGLTPSTIVFRPFEAWTSVIPPYRVFPTGHSQEPRKEWELNEATDQTSRDVCSVSLSLCGERSLSLITPAVHRSAASQGWPPERARRHRTALTAHTPR